MALGFALTTTIHCCCLFFGGVGGCCCCCCFFGCCVHAKYEIYKTATTVGQARQLGAESQDLRNNRLKENIEISDEVSTPPPKRQAMERSPGDIGIIDEEMEMNSDELRAGSVQVKQEIDEVAGSSNSSSNSSDIMKNLFDAMQAMQSKNYRGKEIDAN